MPELNSVGMLTQEEKDKVIAWLEKEKNIKKLTCSICQSTKWQLGDHLVAPMVYTEGAFNTGPTYPFVMLICRNCGNTVFLSAVMIGLLPPGQRPEELKKEEADG